MNTYDEKYMLLAIEEAKKALSLDEVPVGCVIVKDNQIISTGYNMKEKFNMVTKHAELIAIEKASEMIGNWRLIGCDIYITLEPCPMCASAIKQSRINNVYCGLNSKGDNNIDIVNTIFLKDQTNPSVNLYNNLAVEKVNGIMKKFFKNQRKK